MFSGIVFSGRVERVEKRGEDMRISLHVGPLSKEIHIGDSVSINGVCLTVVEKNGKTIAFDVMPETQERTDLGRLNPLEKVNIELSLTLADRIGGHFVLGHVDGIGTISKKKKDGRYVKIWIKTNPQLTKMMVSKGAVALDGVSMTLVDIEKDRFSVCCIPHTLEITTFGSKKEGDSINIEIDMLGKYIKKFLGEMK